jgi:hypothetical protein
MQGLHFWVKIPFKRDKRVDGILSYLTWKYGGNVHDKGIVTITANDTGENGITSPLRNAANLTDYSRCRVCNGEWSHQWVCWDFHELRVRPTQYTIRSPDLGTWVVETSLDGEAWKEIDRRRRSWVGSFGVSHSAEACRFIRLTQTEPNHYGKSELVIWAFEVFGTLIE